jgi:two-component system alkaline phosphatase synthesis response regulator PhoP
MADRILIVEDETIIRELLSDNLEYEGFETQTAIRLKDADKLLGSEIFSAILLDVNLPDGNGIEKLKVWRDQGKKEPCIVCTVRDREIDVVKALDAGADDYVTKPFRIRELIARLKAVLRRTRDISSNDFNQIGKLRVCFASKTATENDEIIQLTTTEWLLLEYLFINKNNVISREQIIERLWGIKELEDSRAVDVHIGRLRKKLEHEKQPEVLLTSRGFGYTLRI